MHGDPFLPQQQQLDANPAMMKRKFTMFFVFLFCSVVTNLLRDVFLKWMHGDPFLRQQLDANPAMLIFLIKKSYLALVWHVLATLHGPHKIELSIRKRLLQSISNLQRNLPHHKQMLKLK